MSATGDPGDHGMSRIEDAFHRAAALPPPEREAFLVRIESDPAVRAEVTRLLHAADSPVDPFGLAGLPTSAAAGPQSVQVGPWRLLREIGAGGMGTVFEAERADGQFVARVAIKLMRGIPTAEGRARLRQERQILAELDHPHIARLLDGGETADGQPYVVMEFVAGSTLGEWLAGNPQGAAQRLALFEKLVAAVAHAHQRLVVHRDVKPGNVMVGPSGEPKLLDFGVSKLLDVQDPELLGDCSTRVFTPGYASPEQREGRAVTTATDVFSLGVLLAEILDGVRPLDADPSRTRRWAAVAVDAELRGIIAKATAVDPRQRYASADALGAELERYRKRLPLQAAPDTTWYRARKFVQRHRGGVSVVLLALIALAAFVWRLAVERERAVAAEANAQRSAQVATNTLQFFTGLFDEVNPDRSAGRSITIGQLLDRARLRIAREVPQGSLQHAMLSGYVASLDAEAGQPQAASRELTAAISALRELGYADTALFAGFADQLASVETGRGEHAAAARWSEEAMKVWQGLAGRRSDSGVALRAAATSEARMQEARGDLGAAAAGFRKALAMTVRYTFEDDRRDDEAQIASSLVDVLMRQGKLADALDVVQQAIGRLERDGPRTSGMQRLQRVRGSLLVALGRSAEALPALDLSISLWREIYGRGGAEEGALLNERGTALNDLGLFAQARRDYEAALAILASVRDGAGLQVLRSNLANACDSEGDYACAITGFEAVLAGAQGNLRDPDRWVVMQGLARACSQAGQHARARSLLGQVLKEAGAAGENGAYEVAYSLVHSARNELRAGAWAAASAYSARARTAFAGIVDPGHSIFGSLDRIDAFIALGTGDIERAAKRLEVVHDATRANDGPDSYWTTLAALDLAEARHAQGRDDEARALLRTHLPLLRARVRETHVNRAAAERLARELGVVIDAGS
jgi:tetratricopeptide (TPR) repeat protein